MFAVLLVCALSYAVRPPRRIKGSKAFVVELLPVSVCRTLLEMSTQGHYVFLSESKRLPSFVNWKLGTLFSRPKRYRCIKICSAATWTVAVARDGLLQDAVFEISV